MRGRWRLARIGAAALGMALGPSAAAEEMLRTRISANPMDIAYVGQYVSVTVDLLSPGQFAGEPTFDLPEVEGGIILQLGSQGTHGSEQIDGQSWHVVLYSFALFLQRPGSCLVPPIGLRFSAGGGLPPLQTEPVPIEAIMPKGAETLGVLVSTPALTVKEDWSPDVTAGKEGDAIIRTITMTAENVLGMGFPPLMFLKPEGLGMYPRDPAVEDTIHRGDFTGTRIESATYVCERAGEYELPAIHIPWFDLSMNQLKQVVLPARVITVAANPELEAGTNPPGRGTGQRRFHMFPLLAVVLITAAAGCVWRFRSGLKHSFEAWRCRRYESEAAYFARFLRAAEAGVAADALESLLRWLDRSGFVGEPATITEFSARAADAELAGLLGTLTDSLYSRGDNPWVDGARLAGAVKTARHVILRRTKAVSSRKGRNVVSLSTRM